MKRLKRFLPGRPTLIIIGSIVVVFVLVATRPKDVPEPRRERAWAVDVIEAQPTTLNPTLELFGQVQSPQDAQLSAAVEGVVLEMHVRDGDTVAEDDLLATLDDRDAMLALQQSEADLKEAEAQLNFARVRVKRSRQAYAKEQELLDINRSRARRAEEIFGEGLLSQSDLDTANENLARQQLAVNQAELTMEETAAGLIELEARIERLTALRDRAALDVDRTRVRAPFPGVVSELEISVGDRVRVGDTLLRLQNPESLEIRAQVPSRMARDLSSGLQEGSRISALVEVEGRQIEGYMARVSRQTRSGSGGVDSFIAFDDDVTGLRLGSTVRVLVELPAEANVIAVPGEAIYGRDRIYKLDGDRMQMVAVERVGEREYMDGRTEVLIRAPVLGPDDQIIVTKLANATDGLLVKPSTTTMLAEGEPSASTGSAAVQSR